MFILGYQRYKLNKLTSRIENGNYIVSQNLDIIRSIITISYYLQHYVAM